MTPFLSRSLQSKQSVNCVVLTKLLSRSADFNSIRGVVDGCQSGHFTLTQKEDFECGSSQGDGSIKMDDMDLKGNIVNLKINDHYR
ncbi:hypothetical protein FOXB_06594 [Fusarium oxysporum f. sp. conglutinans Fo5176]|uniref:Uncharacterized protein n=1 Tax=Fusarium oxysporum (strain Fo5176) TaxID=660025 RepID=F9FJL5_FUSOF|nr:hypothetical protein FOXB_06594 [Fusarium oxysporum f. sp. conglutinans Fo5176]